MTKPYKLIEVRKLPLSTTYKELLEQSQHQNFKEALIRPSDKLEEGLLHPKGIAVFYIREVERLW